MLQRWLHKTSLLRSSNSTLSATLAVGGSFSHLSDVIGVKPTKEEILPSSFDLSTQGFLYIPRDLPHMTRKAPEYQDAVNKRIDRCVELVKM